MRRSWKGSRSKDAEHQQGEPRFTPHKASESRQRHNVERCGGQESKLLVEKDSGKTQRHTLEEHPLPGWAGEIGCTNWPQFLLKFIVSHPGVTCAIPATIQVEHVKENMAACYGVLPDQNMRNRMIEYVEKII